jgi:hypothetical protein
MIIRIIPEDDKEKQMLINKFGSPTLEHENVKEYFIFGNKKDADGDVVDFHEWSGSYRYLLSSLSYFHDIINDDRRNASEEKKQKLQLVPKANRIPTIPMEEEAEEIIEDVNTFKMKGKKADRMIKRGEIIGNAEVTPIDIDNFVNEMELKKNDLKAFKDNKNIGPDDFEDDIPTPASPLAQDKSEPKGLHIVP